jgi:hypothetical protein
MTITETELKKIWSSIENASRGTVAKRFECGDPALFVKFLEKYIDKEVRENDRAFLHSLFGIEVRKNPILPPDVVAVVGTNEEIMSFIKINLT